MLLISFYYNEGARFFELGPFVIIMKLLAFGIIESLVQIIDIS